MKAGRLFFSGGLLVLFSLSTASSATLTAAFLFGADATGNATDQEWDTRAESDQYKLWFTEGTPDQGLTNAFLNGPGWSDAPIFLHLHSGTNQFTIYGEPGLPRPFVGLNLFFENQTVPQISVRGAERTDSAVPEFFANTASRTWGLNDYGSGGASTPGAGAFWFYASGEKVSLTDFFWAVPAIFSTDRVSPHSIGESGENDFIGTFTIVVSEAPVVATRPVPSSVEVSQVRICWDSEPDEVYLVQYRTAAQGNSWTDIGGQVAGDGTRKCVTDAVSPGQPQRIYRVVALE
jgi:hypothetical protein